MKEKIIECVPNFSEGRDKKKVAQIVESIEKINGIRILNIDSGFSSNRTVITFAGEPDKVAEAAFNAIKKASHLIDMRLHKGIHPRIGATDVCPLIPVQNVSIEETIEYAKKLAWRVGNELNIPVYCYEYSASEEKRIKLENIRKGQYELLNYRIRLPEWKPDFGPATFNARSGATVIGVRNLLVAANIILDTKLKSEAEDIAGIIRESGTIRGISPDAKKIIEPGKFKDLKAIGWYLEEYGLAQVSCNFTNINTTPIHVVYEEVKKIAAMQGIRVKGIELIGLIPLQCLTEAGKYYNESASDTEEHLVKTAIEKLELNTLKQFETDKRVLEYVLLNRFREVEG